MIITESRRTAKFYHIFLLIAGGGKRSPAALGKINGSCCRDHERLLPPIIKEGVKAVLKHPSFEIVSKVLTFLF